MPPLHLQCAPVLASALNSFAAAKYDPFTLLLGSHALNPSRSHANSPQHQGTCRTACDGVQCPQGFVFSGSVVVSLQGATRLRRNLVLRSQQYSQAST